MVNLTYPIEAALADAVQECWESVADLEERGGVILQKKADYIFIPLTNYNTGTPIAPVLWTADRYEYGEKVIPLFKKGWQQHGSFHTHPQFSNTPSEMDTGTLFPGFPFNYIFSGLTKTIAKYWLQDTVNAGKVLAVSFVSYD